MEIVTVLSLMRECQGRLAKASRELFRLAEDKAEAEQKYRSALAQEILVLKTQGLQATLIPDVARGNTADLKLQRDLADGLFTAGRDSISALQSEARILDSMLKYQKDMGGE